MRRRKNLAGAPRPRRGMILLIVLVMLTLFAIAGVTFVLYADATSESARFYRDAESFVTSGGPDMDPTTSFNLFLGQLIYGVNDTDTFGPYTALRGHSLAETMYGSWDALSNVPMDQPYDGVGPLHYMNPTAFNQDDYNLVNYTYFANDGFVRDPGRYLARANLGAARGAFVAQNAPYTTWDRDSMFLAELQESGPPNQIGTVIVPSYYRQAIFDPLKQGPANPNWTNPQGKYLTMRPRPVDMGQGFPSPTAINGQPDPNNCDLRNLPWGSQNDSIWIDINAPVLSTAGGLKYKMLVAPLVIDLDNKLNLNVVGNILASYGGSGAIHASNQGSAAWQMNMGKVLNAAGAPAEWKNIFVGGNGVVGRYGASQLPQSFFAINGAAPHIYAPVDLNGVIDPVGGSAGLTGALTQLPSPGVGFFPLFPAGYGNGAYFETTNNGQPPPNGTPIHPMYYNPFSSTATSGPNRTLPLSAHASLLWAGIRASGNSDLVKLCPTNFPSTDPATDPNGSLRRILETTALSMDLDRVGVSPYLWDQVNAASPYQIVFNPAAAQPNNGYVSNGAAPSNFPYAGGLTATPPGTAPPATGSDFDPNTWRYVEPVATPPAGVKPTAPGRIDLDRPLTPYVGQAYGVAGNPAQAAADREQFAWDIFDKLLAVTGMTPVYNAGTATVSAQQYATLRWLAQLSANIVDYIDTDDVMTAFLWTASPQGSDTGYVFGTELPKLTVNEIYMEYDNDSQDPTGMPKKATNPYHVNVWAELVNPLPSATDPNAPPNGIGVNNDAKLFASDGTTPAYQIVLTKQNQGLRNPANPGNVAGDPDGASGANPPYAAQPYTPGTDFDNPAGAGSQVLATFNQWGNVQSVTPLGANTSSPPGAGSNQGFLVVGPPNPPLFMGQDPKTQVQIQASVQAPNTTQTNSMSYKVPLTDPDANTPGNNNLAPTILLQRLANPYQPFNAKTNPYVTVDYADMRTVGAALGGKAVINDARGYDNVNGAIANAPNSPNSRVSFGRKQPYAGVAVPGAACQWQQQTAAGALQPNDPTTTFFSLNSNPTNPPTWLVHLDRPLVSPAELLNVSGFKPHELTQQVINADGKDSSMLNAPGVGGHVAPWLDPNMRLYRLLEFVQAKVPTPGVVPLGRVPGKININTLDPTAAEVFDAMADPQGANNFGPSGPYFNNLIAARNAAGPFIGEGQGTFVNGDQQYPTAPYGAGAGLMNTLMTNMQAGGGLTNRNSTNRYQQIELLNKIFDNVTTRSNTFAVWLTVGFFRVTDDTSQPVKLGEEINAAQGKNIRHQMFAIVDRTQINTFSTTVGVGGVAAGAGQPINIPNPVGDPRTGRSWTIVPGSMLVYDPGLATEETVVVQAGNTATFQFGHGQGATVVSRGHPGGVPWTPAYDARQDTQVVPYFVIID